MLGTKKSLFSGGIRIKFMAKKKGARTKLREHFLSNIGRLMGSDELRDVAGNPLNLSVQESLMR